MNENSKTLTFVGTAAVLLGLGVWLSLPVSEKTLVDAQLGQEFFPEFTDPLKVAGAEIIDFDATTDAKHDLKVEKKDDVWLINPGRQAYPGVSPERLANVVKAVSGIKKLNVIPASADKHREYGVVDPGSEAELKEGSSGVGKRVTLTDGDNKKLVDLIIGKRDDKKTNIIYVREPNRDPIYATEVDTAPLSASFGDWVPPDLLQVGEADLRRVDVHDFAIDTVSVRQQGPGGLVLAGSRPQLVERAKLDAKKDDSDKWQLGKLETFDGVAKTFVEKKIADDEEVDSTKFDDLKRALAGLKIVDAKKKPEVLAEEFAKEKNFLENPASPAMADDSAMISLRRNGFWISPKSAQSRDLEIVPEEGELKVGFDNGVEYQLRFGGLVRSERAGDEKKEGDAKEGDAKPGEAKPGDAAAEGDNTAPNRYLLVTARYNADLIPPPPALDLPPEGEATPTAPAATPAATPTATPAATPKPADAPKPADGAAGSCEPGDATGEACQPLAPKDDAAQPSGTKPQPAATPTATPSATPTATPTASGTAAKPAPAASATATSTDSTPKPVTVSPNDDDIKPATPAAAAKPADEAKPAKKPMTPEERARLIAEHKRMTEKYEADKKAGQEKAKELNKQFAAWYYVVDDATYRKLDLSPPTIARKKSAAPPPGPDPHGGQMTPDIQRLLQQQIMQQQMQRSGS
jgi:hypothetical protein